MHLETKATKTSQGWLTSHHRRRNHPSNAIQVQASDIAQAIVAVDAYVVLRLIKNTETIVCWRWFLMIWSFPFD